MGAHSKPRTEADRAFTRFCRSGDPDELALVFDATAGRLALVAAHLTGDRFTAEDLVQTTFLEAIRSAQSFEPGRPVLPWLLTILTRRAANELRRRGRGERPGSQLKLEQFPSGAQPTLSCVAEQEAVARITEAIDALPKPYREVLALRHIHDLSAIEIARALDRPLGTVHSQLQRGVERLRAVLPVALAGAFCALLDSPTLAFSRSRILEAAASARVAPTLTFLIGGLALKKLVLVAGVLVTLALSWWIADQASVAPHELEAVGRPLSSLSLPAMTPEGEIGASAQSKMQPGSSRQSVPFPDEVEDSSEILLTGRVISSDTKRPLPGAEITIRHFAMRPMGANSASDLPEPETQSTSFDGQFAIRFRQQKLLGAGLEITFPGHVPVGMSVGELRSGVRVDLGDVELTRGVELHIRVVDETDAPVAGYEVSLKSPEIWQRTGPGLWPNTGWDIVATDLGGRLAPKLLLPGRWSLTAWSRMGFAVPESRSINLDGNDRRRDWTIRVMGPDLASTVSGIVIDEFGVPYLGLQLFGEQSTKSGLQTTRSRTGGEFFFGSMAAGAGALRIRLDSRRRDVQLIAPLKPIGIGTEDLRVVVHRIDPIPFRLHIVDESGEPLQQVSYVCAPVRHESEATRLLRLPGNNTLGLRPTLLDSQGVLQRDDLLPGVYLIFIRHHAELVPELFAHEVELLEGTAFEQRVVIPSLESWTVTVLDELGEPVQGSHVELLRAIGKAQIGQRSFAYSALAVFDRGVQGTSIIVVVAEGQTDANGQLEVMLAPGDSSLAARATSSIHTPGFSATNMDSRHHIEVRVQRAARIRGVLKPLDVLHAWGPTTDARAEVDQYTEGQQRLDRDRPRIRAIELNAPERARRLPGVTVGDDGHFELDSVPSGSWQLYMDVKSHFLSGVQGDTYAVGLVLDVTAGEVRDVLCDISDYGPIRIRGRALLDGVPVRGSRLGFFAAESYTGAKTDKDGWFEIPASAPGDYLPCLYLGEPQSERLPIPSARLLQGRAGQVIEQTFNFTSQGLEFLITDAEGLPLVGRHVSLHVEKHGQLAWWPAPYTLGLTDSQGRVVFPSVPPFECELVLWNARITPNYDQIEEPHSDLCTTLGTFLPRPGQERFIEVELAR